MRHLPSEWKQLLLKFKPVFTAPSFDNFVTLMIGWVLCTTRHFITRIFRFGELAINQTKHHSAYYRFLKDSNWDLNRVSEILFHLLVSLVSEERILIFVDDTLCHRSGPHIWGLGVHYDAVSSSYGKAEGVKRKNVYSTGHNWVIMSLLVPLPWGSTRGMSIPFCFRLYRAKQQTSEQEYKKRTTLATQMETMISGWLPEDRGKLYFVGDFEYAGETFAGQVETDSEFVGPMVMDAAFYDSDPEQTGTGRPKEKGKRLLTPQELAEGPSRQFKEVEVQIYGKKMKLQYKTQVGQWWSVTREKKVKMVVVRDPEGRLDDRAYYSTDPDLEVEEMIKDLACRWGAEVMHRNVKQHMGIEEPRNGYKQSQQPEESDPKDPRIRKDPENEEDLAAKRTVPLGLVAYALVVIWYLKNGSKDETVERKCKQAPYWREKQTPSFGDMLEEARIGIWKENFFPDPVADTGIGKIIRKILPFLSAA